MSVAATSRRNLTFLARFDSDDTPRGCDVDSERGNSLFDGSTCLLTGGGEGEDDAEASHVGVLLPE